MRTVVYYSKLQDAAPAIPGILSFVPGPYPVLPHIYCEVIPHYPCRRPVPISCSFVLRSASLPSPGPIRQPRVPHELWFCFEAGHVAGNRIRQMGKRNLGRRILVAAG